jgi:rubrerythrin
MYIKITMRRLHMPVAKSKAAKKTTAAKKPAAATTKKVVKKAGPAAKKKVAKGDTYVCGVCGLAVTVDETCGCVDFCDIICCGKQMKPRVKKAS